MSFICISMNDVIICRLDGKKILSKHFARHLKIHHQKEYRDYIKENISDFAPVWNLCPICGNLVKGKACSGKCLSQYYSSIRVGLPKGPMLDETKKKLSDDRKQKYANGWSPRIGKFHTKESKQKNALAHLGKKIPSMSGDFSPSKRKEVREKMSKTRIDRGLSKGENNPMFGKTHTPETIQKIFSHRKMNKLEKMVADEFDKVGVSYYFQFFITEGKVCKSYDFKIKGKPLIIEVDGDFWHGNPNVKHHYEKVDEVKTNDLMKDIIASERGYKVIRLWESDIKKDPSVILKALA